MVAQVRCWFIRDALGLIEREHGAGSVARALARLGEQARAQCEPELLRRSSPTDTLPLHVAEDLLLTLDSALGDGSGRLLERLGLDLATRTLSQSGTSVIVGDLFATVARLRVPVEHPFVDAAVRFEVFRSPAGFTVEVYCPGHPRMARALRHLVAGLIVGAQRFAGSTSPRVRGETRGDQVRLEVSLASPAVDPASQEPPQPSRRQTRPTLRHPTQPSLSAQVDAIFAHRPSLANVDAASSSQPPPSSVRPTPDAIERSSKRTDPLAGRPSSQTNPFAPFGEDRSNKRTSPWTPTPTEPERGSRPTPRRPSSAPPVRESVTRGLDPRAEPDEEPGAGSAGGS
ncbi:MAG: hypothetical protein KF718_15505 [Polyangiaceae bacterium]|nr:hypothetical protein [Polyangiaceae bacterium]